MKPSYIDNADLVELLDKIDDTAPRSCQTCKFSQVHTKLCDRCLYDGEEERTQTLNAERDYFYHNWDPGNWLREVDRAQKAGEQCIVIGGQGEADFYATNSSKHVVNHLRRVAAECGYRCGGGRTIRSPRTDQDEFRLNIGTNEGEFTVVWDKESDALIRIDQLVPGIGEVQTWPLLEKAPGSLPDRR